MKRPIVSTLGAIALVVILGIFGCSTKGKVTEEYSWDMFEEQTRYVPDEYQLKWDDSPQKAFEKIQSVVRGLNSEEGYRIWKHTYPKESWKELLKLIVKANEFYVKDYTFFCVNEAGKLELTEAFVIGKK